eukprot:8649176-Heterocapsa_arctica.AAC.1
MKEREHSVQEKEAQKKLYDALTDGIHGNRIEKYNKGYKFNMDAHSLHGWVPHAFIYAWLKANA